MEKKINVHWNISYLVISLEKEWIMSLKTVDLATSQKWEIFQILKV